MHCIDPVLFIKEKDTNSALLMLRSTRKDDVLTINPGDVQTGLGSSKKRTDHNEKDREVYG